MDSKIATSRVALLLGTALNMSSAFALEPGDAERGKAVSATCVACHQANGAGINIPGGQSWPRLAGQNAEHLAKQLHDFKSGKRTNVSMAPFANMLNDQQIADVTTYFSEMDVTAGGGAEEADEATLTKGKLLATQGDWDRYIVSCESCHGPGGTGVGSNFPGIASQHADYIESQLQAWKKGERTNDPQHLMGSFVKRMTDEDIKAVSVWYASQTVNTEAAIPGEHLHIA